MVWLPGPLSLLLVEWVVRAGAPMVRQRLMKAPPREVLFEGAAALERGAEQVDGMLSVTREAVVFTPGSLRTRSLATDIPLEEVERAVPASSRLLGLLPVWPNAIKLRTRRGIFRFIVDRADRDLWVREIEEARRATSDAGRLPGSPSNPA